MDGLSGLRVSLADPDPGPIVSDSSTTTRHTTRPRRTLAPQESP